MQVMISPEMRQIIVTGCREIAEKLLAQAPESDSGKFEVWRQEAQRLLLAAAAETWQPCRDNSGAGGEASDDKPKHIVANGVIMEIIDKESGRLFRRELPLHYSETGNGILLSGEDVEGRPAVIAFFSGTAMQRLGELFGRGPDRPRCGEHEHGDEAAIIRK